MATFVGNLWGCAGELVSALTAAIVLADASVTPPSPKMI